jgi:hypothetical protein
VAWLAEEGTIRAISRSAAPWTSVLADRGNETVAPPAP